MRMIAMSARLVMAVMLTATVPLAAEAMPLTSAVQDRGGSTLLTTIQARPGYHAGQQYRRAMRRYRGHPGARYELRQNRRAFCRGAPQYC